MFNGFLLHIVEVLGEIGVADGDDAQAEERAGQGAHRRDRLEGLGQETGKELPERVRDPLDAAVEQHRHDAKGEVEPHRQRRQLDDLAQRRVDEPRHQHHPVDADIALAHCHLVAGHGVAGEAAQRVHLQDRDRCVERVRRGPAEEKPRPEGVLVAEGLVEGVEHGRQPRPPEVHQDRRQDRPAQVEGDDEVEERHPMPGQPIDASIEAPGHNDRRAPVRRLPAVSLPGPVPGLARREAPFCFAQREASFCLAHDLLCRRYIPRSHPIPRASNHCPMTAKLSVKSTTPTSTIRTPMARWMITW